MARTPASCKIGRVLVLLALFWACQQTVQTVRAAVVRAVPCARHLVGAWARKPLIARRASKADVQPGEADDKEDDKAGMVCRFGVTPLLCCKVSQLAKQHDAVQSYKANEVTGWVRDFDPKDISEFAGQEYAGKDLLAMGVAELDNLELAKGPRRRLIESIKKLQAAAAIRQPKLKLRNAGTDDEGRIKMVGDMLSALVELQLKDKDLLQAAIDVIKKQLEKLQDDQGRIKMVGDMLSALVELDANSVMSSALQDVDVTSVLEQACNATRSDVKSYGPKQVAAWTAAKLVSAKYDAAAIQQALGVLKTSGPTLLNITSQDLQRWGLDDRSIEKTVLEAVQSLSDPSALTFRDLVNDEAKVQYNYQNKVWVYGRPTSFPPCGYVPDAQMLKISINGTHSSEILFMNSEGKSCIPTFHGESGSGKTLLAVMKPAILLQADQGDTVRVFTMTVSAEEVQEISQAQSKDDRDDRCKAKVMNTFKKCIKSALGDPGGIVTQWLEHPDPDDLGNVVFVIDEIGTCLDFARGVAAQQEDIYKHMQQFCKNKSQLVMAGTAGAGTVAYQPSVEVSTKPEQVCLVFVGSVKDATFGRALCEAMLPLETCAVRYDDLMEVKSMKAYLSNARTAVLLVEEVARWVNKKPANVAKETVRDAWKRSPHLTSYLVPSKYRMLNGLQSVTCIRDHADCALKLLMHPSLLESKDIPEPEVARRCVTLGLVAIPDSQQAAAIHAPTGSKSYFSTTTFDSSEALKQMLLAAFEVPAILPKDGLSLELVVAEAQRRFSEVLTGNRATLKHLPYAMPPVDNQDMEGIPENTFVEILDALASQQTVVLVNGPSAQGADIILLRAAQHTKNCTATKPFVRFVQVKNQNRAANQTDVVRTLGVAAKANASQSKFQKPNPWSAMVLNWFCRVVSEKNCKNLTRHFGQVRELKGKPREMDVDVELVLLERELRGSSGSLDAHLRLLMLISLQALQSGLQAQLQFWPPGFHGLPGRCGRLMLIDARPLMLTALGDSLILPAGASDPARSPPAEEGAGKSPQSSFTKIAKAEAGKFRAVVEKELASKLVAKSGRDPKVFGRSLSPAELEARLQSCLKTSQRGTPFLKTKLNWDRVRFWDTEGYPLQEPGDLAGRSARVRLELRQVWVMNPQCGLLLEVTDLQLQESEPAKVECSFG
ncbi:unnamed protein product [Symbiodinium natans]|uniref:SAM domain-containing protein n=1 Tax=Symbiodinium natans TaxID=878477 RepID=A0A812TSQ7_9DINO|nr:unnamed protein product [Symbiodinium natans]